jgi:regulation of enolase protein 1 (concanavalin A-like superfamily)
VESFRLSSIPAEIQWQGRPVAWDLQPQGVLEILSGRKSDLFIDPASGTVNASAPAAVFAPPDECFLLAAKVKVAFASTFDAGVLLMHVRQDLWAKLCFELSPQAAPTIVSVATRGVSDDCNSTVVQGDSVYLRIAQGARSTAFHFSLDGRCWQLVRSFSLGSADGLRIGFSSQSPTGAGCRASFSEITYEPRTLRDIRDGT